MRKSIFLSLMLIILALSAFGQEEQNKLFWRSEMGVAFTGTGDVWGITMKNGLGYNLTDHLDMVGYFELQDFRINNINVGQDYRNLGINFLYNLNLFKALKLTLGLGSYVRNTMILSSFGIIYDPLTGDPIYTIRLAAKYWSVGYYTTLVFEVPISSRVSFTINLSLQNDTKADITETAKAGIKIRL